MEPIKIYINKENKDILIKSSEGKETRILEKQNELKATDIINFLQYDDNKKYVVEELEEGLKDNRNIVYIHKIFESIVDKINQLN